MWLMVFTRHSRCREAERCWRVQGYDTLTGGGRAVCNHYRGEHCLACVALVGERYIPCCFCVSEGVEF